MRQLFFTLLFFSLFFTQKSKAQAYSSSFGVRLSSISGSYLGLNYKKFIGGSDRALDIILQSDFESGLTLTALVEKHKETMEVKNLFWYYGVGGHFGLYDGGDDTYFHAGLDAVLGIEYVVSEIPFAFSLDYIPSIDISQNYDRNFAFVPNNFTLGIKYTFGNTAYQALQNNKDKTTEE